MKLNFENFNELPDGDLLESEIIIQTEWEVPNEGIIMKSIERVIETFNKYSLNDESSKGILSYYCFLNTDNRHIIHFSQWKNKMANENYSKNDPKERITELLANLDVKRLYKTEFIPYQTFIGTNKKEETGLIVFVKQYFEGEGQAKDWIDLILNTLEIEKPIRGFIKNTYYLSENGKEFLNYGLWKSEDLYNQFLEHNNKNTANNWKEIENFESRIKEKSEVKRNKKFIKIK